MLLLLHGLVVEVEVMLLDLLSVFRSGARVSIFSMEEEEDSCRCMMVEVDETPPPIKVSPLNSFVGVILAEIRPIE